MVCSDTPAMDDGSKNAQVFVGRCSCVADAYSVESVEEFAHTLTDVIRKRGAMDAAFLQTTLQVSTWMNPCELLAH